MKDKDAKSSIKSKKNIIIKGYKSIVDTLRPIQSFGFDKILREIRNFSVSKNKLIRDIRKKNVDAD